MRRDEHAAAGDADDPAADGDLADVGPLEPGDAAQRRGLAAAGGPEQVNTSPSSTVRLTPSTASTSPLPDFTGKRL